MAKIIYIGGSRDVRAYRNAGIPSYAPPCGLLAERVLAERPRCDVLAMTRSTFAALPAPLARELREAGSPRVTILPDFEEDCDAENLRDTLRQRLTEVGPAPA